VNHNTKITEPEPFNLLTDIRGEIQQRAIREQLEKEQISMEKAKEFHANPLPSLEPFIPARSTKPLTEIQTFSHHLDVRAEERKEYEEEQSRKQQEEEQARLEYEEMKRVIQSNLF
jgi:targeting protein for Xklp2